MADEERTFARMLTNIDSVLREISASNIELTKQMQIAAQMQEIKYLLSSMNIAPLVKETDETIIVADENMPIDTKSFTPEKRENLKEQSDSLGRAYNEWRNIQETISKLIDNPDDMVISVSIPADKNLKITDNVHHCTASLLMVAATNTKAYVLTKDTVGFHHLSAAEHWDLER